MEKIFRFLYKGQAAQDAVTQEEADLQSACAGFDDETVRLLEVGQDAGGLVEGEDTALLLVVRL